MSKALSVAAGLALALALLVVGTALRLGVLTPGCIHEYDVIDSVTPDTWPLCPDGGRGDHAGVG